MSAKRVAIIIDTLNGGGAEKVCLTLFKSLLNKNVDAHLIVLKPKCDYELPQLPNIHFVFRDSKTKLSHFFGKKKAAVLLNQLVVRLGNFDALFSNLDVTHAIVAKAKLPHCFYVVHNSIEKSLAMHRQLGWLKYWRKRKAINVLNHKKLITVSKGIKTEILAGDIIQPQSITTIYNPVDLADIQDKSQLMDQDIPKNNYLIFMGRMAKQKRVDVLIKAFQYVQTPLELVVLTNNTKKLNKIIKQHNFHNKKITGVGFKQNPYPLIKQAKALVLSSDFEGLGMVLIEALACGTPVVSTDCPHGPSEILTGDLQSFLSPVGDAQALAKKIDAAVKYQVNNPYVLTQVNADEVAEQYLKLADSH